MKRELYSFFFLSGDTLGNKFIAHLPALVLQAVWTPGGFQKPGGVFLSRVEGVAIFWVNHVSM